MKSNKAKEIIDNALDSLIDSLENGKSEEFINFLDVMSKFNNYSIRNTMLIARQRPDSTKVAGFHAWNKLGRYVTKGEKGIAIIAPLVAKQDTNEKETSESDESIIKVYKVVYVFDISQTKGKELPSPTQVHGDPKEYLEKLDKFTIGQGIDVEFVDSDEYQGRSLGGKILIQSGLFPACEFSVKVHELAHEFLHHSGQKYSKTVAETEAESIAYVVSNAIGLNTNTDSSDYIQLYQGDKDTLLDSIERIRGISGTILEGLGK